MFLCQPKGEILERTEYQTHNNISIGVPFRSTLVPRASAFSAKSHHAADLLTKSWLGGRCARRPGNAVEQLAGWDADTIDFTHRHVLQACRPAFQLYLPVTLLLDASETAYGTVCYIKVLNPNKNQKVSFVIGKLRLAQLKLVTIFILELCGSRTSSSPLRGRQMRGNLWHNQCVLLVWLLDYIMLNKKHLVSIENILCLPNRHV